MISQVLIKRQGVNDKQFSGQRRIENPSVFLRVLKKVLCLSRLLLEGSRLRLDQADELRWLPLWLACVMQKFLGGHCQCVNRSQVFFKEPKQNCAFELPSSCVHTRYPYEARVFLVDHRFSDEFVLNNVLTAFRRNYPCRGSRLLSKVHHDPDAHR